MRLISSHGKKGRLIDQVGKISANHAGGHTGQNIYVQVVFSLNLLQVNFEDVFSANLIGSVDQYLTVKATRPKQGRIQNFGAVGCGHQDNAHVGIKSVQFNQKLI